ncbi:MAG TPA: hypothetical protein DHU93_05300, partial [Algoriphagus sp.]|nr:hypothetical protein [Algoriphagus sp.]
MHTKEYYRKSLFQEKGNLRADQIERIEFLEKSLQKSFLKIALNYGYLSRRAWKKALIEEGVELYQFNFESLEAISNQEVVKTQLHRFLDCLVFPLKQTDDYLEVVLSDPSDSININNVEELLGQKVDKFHVAEDLDVLKALHITYGLDYLDKAIFRIYDSDRESCAIETFTKKQLIFIGAILILGASLFYFFPVGVAITFNL